MAGSAGRWAAPGPEGDDAAPEIGPLEVDRDLGHELWLQYATEGSGQLNEQILCEWRDDGGGVIRAERLTGWVGSGLRRIEVARYRTRTEFLGASVLFLLATFDSVPPVAP